MLASCYIAVSNACPWSPNKFQFESTILQSGLSRGAVEFPQTISISLEIVAGTGPGSWIPGRLAENLSSAILGDRLGTSRASGSKEKSTSSQDIFRQVLHFCPPFTLEAMSSDTRERCTLV